MYRPNAYRSKHRSLNHEQAHADAQQALRPEVPSHPLILATEPILVTSQTGLAEVIASVRSAGTMAYDSEFIGEETYHPLICLLQVATPSGLWLIDPLAGLDLSGFWQLVVDATIEKVVHAGFQDLEPAGRHTGQPPRNIFDTQIAAAFAGCIYPMSLAKLVLDCFNVELGKGLKFSQWDQRPLSNVQTHYAANDVRYLLAIRQALGSRIAQRGNELFAAQELSNLSDMSLYRTDPAQAHLRIRGAELLRRRQQAILRELLNWRDTQARTHDIPPRTFLKDGVLMELARRPIKEITDLSRIRGLPRPIEKQFGQAILDTTNVGRTASVEDLKQGQWIEDTAEHRAAVDAIWTKVQKACADRGIDAAVVTSRREVGRCVRRITDTHSLADEPLMLGWRGELLGAVLHATLTDHVVKSASLASSPKPAGDQTTSAAAPALDDEDDDHESNDNSGSIDRDSDVKN
jgi:ribonuclease D